MMTLGGGQSRSAKVKMGEKEGSRRQQRATKLEKKVKERAGEGGKN